MNNQRQVEPAGLKEVIRKAFSKAITSADTSFVISVNSIEKYFTDLSKSTVCTLVQMLISEEKENIGLFIDVSPYTVTKLITNEIISGSQNSPYYKEWISRVTDRPSLSKYAFRIDPLIIETIVNEVYKYSDILSKLHNLDNLIQGIDLSKVDGVNSFITLWKDTLNSLDVKTNGSVVTTSEENKEEGYCFVIVLGLVFPYHPESMDISIDYVFDPIRLSDFNGSEDSFKMMIELLKLKLNPGSIIVG